jgi:uncharacterized protein YwqG
MDKTLARWQELFAEVLQIEDLDSQAFYEQALPCFYSIYTPQPTGDDTPSGASRRGGYPDLPQDMPWPAYESQAMTFLAQVNFNELEPGFAPYLPQRGWLYFFIHQQRSWTDIPHRVLYFDGPVEALQKSLPPESARPPERTYQTSVMRFETGFTLYGEMLWEMFHQRSRDKGSDKLFEVMFERFQEECTRVGGHPMCFQNLSEQWAYLKLSGFELLHRYGTSLNELEYHIRRERLEDEDPERVRLLRAEMTWQIGAYDRDFPEHKRRMQAVHPIFVLASDGEEMQWGDLGFLQFFIHQDDLARRDFSRTYCDIIST